MTGSEKQREVREGWKTAQHTVRGPESIPRTNGIKPQPGMVAQAWGHRHGTTGMVPQEWCHRNGATEMVAQP